MPNMDLKKIPMPSQSVEDRIKNFDEVALGYTLDMAMTEAQRCLNCKTKPCVSSCPVNVDIPDFIAEVAKGNIEEAYKILSKKTSLPAVCGRVCPQEIQCESKCVRGIKGESVGIGRLERFVADWHRNHYEIKSEQVKCNGKKVAVIGAGPTGITCAGELAKKGYDVTIYEALHIAGGILVYGIPEFCLPNNVVEYEIEKLKSIGVKIETNVVIGKSFTIDDLFDMGYEAVYIGNGAAVPNFMGIPGENLKGVYSANEYLMRINMMQAYLPNSKTPIRKSKNVAVVGGGNVAMDAARCAVRMGVENVYIVYRRGMEELPSRLEEIKHAQEEGIIFKTLTNPVEVIGGENGEVKAIRCVEMTLGGPDESGRRRPIVKENSDFIINVDTVVMAIGTSPSTLISSTTEGLETDKKGRIIIKGDEGATSRQAVYAGGDAVTGPATVILAMGAGKRAAVAIDEMLQKK